MKCLYSIAVWYISGGKPVSIEAEYSNGYITFKTNHFSEYTVTRLLPEERCALYGCVYKETEYKGNCLQDGYTLKLCIRCHKSTKVITHEAKGHNYIETITAATCTVQEKTTYYASITIDGILYEDTKEILGEKLDHTYLDEWHHTSKSHWKECACGDKDGVENHEFDDGVVEVEPTCNKEGQMKYTCECGYTKTESIEPTYEHNYIDRVCSTCGKSDDSCDHNTFTDKTINLKDYGACEGTINYKDCYCGEVCLAGDKFIESLNCDFEKVEETKGVDSNGDDYLKFVGICSKCGLELEYIDYIKENGCVVETRDYYTFKMNNTVVVKNAYLKTEYEMHDVAMETITLKEHSNCGTSIEVLKCVDCDEIVSVININLKCDVEKEQTTQKDSNGVEYTIYTMTCKDCGLVFINKESVKVISDCELITTSERSVNKGSAILYSCCEEEYNNNHNYEETYEKLGETCEDGVNVIRKCSVFDDEFTYVSYEHHCEELFITLDYYNCCDGELTLGECVVCEEIIQIIDYNGNCSIYDYEDGITEIVIDSNQVEHYINTKTCEICGLKWIIDSYIVETNGCDATRRIDTTISVNNRIILNCVQYEKPLFTTQQKQWLMMIMTAKTAAPLL